MTYATLRTLGGSVALTIPKRLLESVSLAAGDRVTVTVESGRIVIAPTVGPRYRLADLLAQCQGKRFAVDREWEAAPPVGQEAL